LVVIFYRYEAFRYLVRQAYSLLEEPSKSNYPPGTRRQLAGEGIGTKLEEDRHTHLKVSAKDIASRKAPALYADIHDRREEIVTVLYRDMASDEEQFCSLKKKATAWHLRSYDLTHLGPLNRMSKEVCQWSHGNRAIKNNFANEGNVTRN
jgi:hypothetical protein